jgi:tight adherence protein B
VAESTPTLRAAVTRLVAVLVAVLGLALVPSVAFAASKGTVTTAPAATTTAPSHEPTTGSQAPATPPASAAATTATVTQTATMTTTTTATTTTATTTTTAKSATNAAARRRKRRNAVPVARAAASPTSLTGWLSPTARFPRRAIVLQSPAHATISPGHLTVTENGRAVVATTTSGADALTDPGAGNFGIELVLADGTSPAGAPLRPEIDASGTLATNLPLYVPLGVLGYSATSHGLVAFKTNSAHSTPGAGVGITAAGLQAVRQVVAGDSALGIVVVVSDGVDVTGSSSALAAAAAAAHVPVVTIGLQDAQSTPASLQAVSRWAPGEFLLATPTGLEGTLQSTVAQVASGYSIVRYRSSAPAGTAVSLSVSAASVPGAVTATYRTPGSAAPPRRVPVRHHHESAASAALRGTTALSPTPSFAAAITPITPMTTSAVATQTGFWHSGAAVLIVALLCALLVGTMVMLLLRRPNRRAARTRVGSYIPSELGPGLVESHEDAPRRSGLVGRLESGTWWPQFVEAVEISRNPKSAPYLMRRAAIIAILVAVLVALISHVVALALVPILAFPFVERWWVMRQATKQRQLFADTLPSYMADIASAIRVGRSLVSALGVVADSANEPTRSELERAVTDEALGRPLDQSLSAVGRRMHSGDMEQFALIAELNRRSGANVAEALDRVAEGARDRADLRREMRALTSQAKMSSSVLTGMPFVLLGALSVISPSYAHPLFHTTFGVIALCFALGFIATGWKVMKKITNVGV